MYNLFTKFPAIYYNNQLAVNLLLKVKFNEAAKRAAAVYYPYTVTEGERPDIIAANYYDDPRYSWLIYMVNDIVDPLHDWPLTEEELNQTIVKKYGSIQKAIDGIAFWRVNWYEDETILTSSGYNALPSYAKKYFTPASTFTGSTSYVRSRIDYAVETNSIQQLSLNSTNGFEIGELVTQKVAGTHVATATIKNIIDNKLVVQHVLGAFVVGNPVVGSDSSVSSNLTTVLTLSTPIPANEANYWSYVSFYDQEQELNEQKRHIKLLDKAYVDQVERELDSLL